MRKKVISGNVLLTGFTSFFTDVSSEMIYPLYQAFVTFMFSAVAGPVIGIIEGIAESTASLLKVYSGYVSDKFQKRKLPAIAGYAVSAISKLLLLLARTGWFMVLTARFFDRVGKGIRTAPRDALIAESSEKKSHGKVFGFHRAMDFAGATLGAIIAYFLVRQFIDPVTDSVIIADSYFFIFLISVIPALLGVIFLFFTKDVTTTDKSKAIPKLSLKSYDRTLKLFLIATVIFTIGNSSNQFLLLRSADIMREAGLGFTLSTTILMYIVFNLVSSLLSTFFGSLSDKIGRKKLLIAGYTLYMLVYAGFVLLAANNSFWLCVLWPLYGIYYAMTEGVEKALVSDLSPEKSRGTALGMYHTLVGIFLLPASIIAGILYTLFPAAPFLFGSCMALVAVVLITIGVRRDDKKELPTDERRSTQMKNRKIN
ncbi:MAG: MFS transporter [Spirochaetaceae bacterium]|nr:MAG: MFS transporter [Spirochaetaceae bacterium]